MRCGFLIWSLFMFQISGHFHGSFRKRPAIPQSVSPLTTVYVSGASLLSSDIVTREAPRAGTCFAASFDASGGMPSAHTPTGTKLAKATTKVIIVFPMATLTCGYGPQDPYSEKGLRPVFQVVR